MRGDHVYVKRRGYTHHGVEVDDSAVIHFTGTPGNKLGAMIRRTAMADFTGPRGKLRYRRYGQQLPADLAIERAESKLGQSGYRLFSNNCEHFATWCVHDRTTSAQVNGAKATGAVVSSAAAGAAAGIGIVSGAGAAAGLSGPGIMSGLATAGGTVGTGAVGGLAVLGVAPGVAAVAVMNIALRDDPTLSESDRLARRAGRAGSAAGAVGGAAAGIGAVSAAGVAGLSGAGITSGLATIGGTVGLGMAAGSAIVIAGPAIAAAGLGYGVYRATRRLRRDDDSTQLAGPASNLPDAELVSEEDVSIAPLDSIEFHDIAADSGRVVQTSLAASDPT